MIKIIKKIRQIYLVKVKYRNFKIGKNFHAGIGVRFWAKNSIIIGDGFYIGRYSQIECDATIGRDVIMGNHVALVGKYDHHYQQIGTAIARASQIRDNHYSWKGLSSRTVIEDDVWIGYGSIIMSGITIKRGCIIAAGSVLTKDTEEYSIYGGNPAKKISPRFDSEKDKELHIKKYYFNLNNQN
jgi:acetyltransferase-like isoleucine patch superfamily enzyme